MVKRFVAVTVAVGLVVLAGPRGAGAAEAPDQDRAFLTTVHQANLAVIAAAELAPRKATTEDVRRHAQLFANDHRRLDAEIRTVAASLEVRLPTEATPGARAELVQLSRLSAARFDAAWLQQQVRVHRAYVEVVQREIHSGSAAPAVAAARRALPVEQAHLSILQETVGRRTPDTVNAGAGGQSAGEPARSAPLGLGLLGVAVALAAVAALLVLVPRRTA